MNLFSLWRQWNPYQSRSIGQRGVLDLFLENNPGMVVDDRRPPPSTHTKSPGANWRRQTSPQVDRTALSKISSFASFQNVGRTCFSTYSFDASHVETGRPPTTALCSDSQPRFKAGNKSRGMDFTRGATPFCSGMKSERAKFRGQAGLNLRSRLLKLPRSKTMSSTILIIF